MTQCLRNNVYLFPSLRLWRTTVASCSSTTSGPSSGRKCHVLLLQTSAQCRSQARPGASASALSPRTACRHQHICLWHAQVHTHCRTCWDAQKVNKCNTKGLFFSFRWMCTCFGKVSPSRKWQPSLSFLVLAAGKEKDSRSRTSASLCDRMGGWTSSGVAVANSGEEPKQYRHHWWETSMTSVTWQQQDLHKRISRLYLVSFHFTFCQM